VHKPIGLKLDYGSDSENKFLFIFILDSSDSPLSQITINNRFAYQRTQKRPKSPAKYFDKKVFKRKILNFIIINNIFFRTVCSLVFKKIIEYLKE
jgi:hypothetical protein